LLVVFHAPHETVVHLRVWLILRLLKVLRVWLVLRLLKVHQRDLYLLKLGAAHTHQYHIQAHEAKQQVG
jgi:hypothetical protein